MYNVISTSNDLINAGINPTNILIYRIDTWMKKYRYNPKNSCGAFMYYMMYGEDFSTPDFWLCWPIETKTNYILLTQTKNIIGKANHHYALYLPEIDKYLSQWGGKQDPILILSTLQEMIDFFETDTIQYITKLDPST